MFNQVKPYCHKQRLIIDTEKDDVHDQQAGTCKLRNHSPAMDTVVENKIHELMIFLDRPRASFQSDLVTTGLSSHVYKL